MNYGGFYLVEHMEGNEISKWVSLEYAHMQECIEPYRLIFTNYPVEEPSSGFPCELERVQVDSSVLEPGGGTQKNNQPYYCASTLNDLKDKLDWSRVCLLDMKAEKPLAPVDASKFDLVVFGGILGNVLREEDGSYSSDDRTAELRDNLGFAHRRHLGTLQMTTDTALLVSKLVLQDQIPLEGIPFIDEPEIDVSEPTTGGGSKNGGYGEITQMEGFRYIAATHPRDPEWFHKIHSAGKLPVCVPGDANGFAPSEKGEGAPILPTGMIEYWRESCDDELDADDIIW